jgi:hypothetical protein
VTGRGGVFRDYRLRVAGVMRDYGLHDRREQAPQDSRLSHDEGRKEIPAQQGVIEIPAAEDLGPVFAYFAHASGSGGVA